MKLKLAIQLLSITAAVSCASNAVAGSSSKQSNRTYHWTDSNGTMHYGDRVPPEHAEAELKILNNQGVEVAHVDGRKTTEELEQEARERAQRAEEIRKREEALLRDRVLLSTYLSVDEIEALRDNRTELVEGQMRVIEIYLDNLRQKLTKLEREAQRFAPYSTDPNARPIDEKLAREISDTLDSILQYEKNLSKSKTERTQLLAKFNADISRFHELKNLN